MTPQEHRGRFWRARLDDERGSLLLALLVAIMAASLGVLALASARTAQSVARRDVDYTTVVQTADAGVQHALSLLNQGLPLTDQVTPIALGGQTFTYDVTPVTGSGSVAYDVQATGVSADGHRRTVVARLQQESRFPYALYTELAIDFNGETEVDSYSSEAVCVVLPACAWAPPYSGAGTVATNTSVLYPGNAESDRTVLFDWAANPDDTRCRFVTTGNCTAPHRQTVDERLDLTTPEELAFIHDMEDQCDTWVANGETTWQTYEASNHTGVPAVLQPPANPAHDFHCMDSVTFDVDTILAPLGSSSLDTRPVIMVVRGDIILDKTVGNGPTVNCVGTCEDDTSIQFPRHLQLYSAEAIEIELEQQTDFAGVIYAPRGHCQPNNGPAGITFFGALVCEGISHVGNWALHYDRALAGIGTGRYVVDGWREEVVVP